MESKFQPSAAAVQELVESMKAEGEHLYHKSQLTFSKANCRDRLFESGRWSDVTITCKHDGVEHKFKAHTTVICPRATVFAYLLESDMENVNYTIHAWDLGPWQPALVDKMLQYLYGLDYQVESQEGTAPDMETHADMWCIGEAFGIKGLQSLAADKCKLSLSEFNVYGAKLGFTISYFEDLVTGLAGVWDATPKSNRILRNQVSTHIQQNIKEWSKDRTPQSRFLQSTYRLIFRELEQETQDFTAMLKEIRVNYQYYLDTKYVD